MRLGDEHEAEEVLLLQLCALHAASAAVLLLVLRERHALDVAAVRERDHARLVGDEVLDRDLVLVDRDLRAALRVLARRELLLQFREVVLDDCVDASRVGEDGLKIGDRGEESGEFRLQLLAFEAGELVEAHVEDRVHLRLGETVGLDELDLRLVAVLRCADDLHHVVEVRDGDEETIEDVLARLGLI